MIIIKTKEQIELMKISATILAEVKQIIWDALLPGKTTLEIDQLAYEEIIKKGGKPAFKNYQGFPGTICISINEEMIHGIPSNRVIKDGDIVKVDMGVIYKGWYSDSAFTKGIGQISKSDQDLIKVAKDAFFAGFDAIKPGARVGDISFAIGEFVKKKGYFVPKTYTGHGIGSSLHEDPYVYNEGIKGTGPLLKDNMIICIEPMILQGSNEVKVLKDNWTVISAKNQNTAHYEHTVLIENGHGIILTEGI